MKPWQYDYTRARVQAQANADYAGAPRYLHSWQGRWYVEKCPAPDCDYETFIPTRTVSEDCFPGSEADLHCPFK